MVSIPAREYFQRRTKPSAGGHARLLGNGVTAMLDLVFIATGAVFLYACVLYAYACDRL
jgi:hypothetical protein